MKLPTDDRKLLHKAIVEAVDTTDNLELLSEIALGRPLNEIGPPAAHPVLVLRVIKTAESFDRVKELIVEAREINVHNVNLRTVAELLLPRLDREINKPSPPASEPNGRELPEITESPKVLPPTPQFTVPKDEAMQWIETHVTSILDSVGTSWADAAELESRMSHAVRSSNSAVVQSICNEVITRLHTTADLIPERTAKWLLSLLRRSRLFAQMTQLAEAMIGGGIEAPQIRRQYSQALIDQGYLIAAEAVLQAINQDPNALQGEKYEARGLIGRIYKQRYVEYATSPLSLNFLNRAINEYRSVYELDPERNVWHGINLVALIARARRDKLSITLPDEDVLAEEILATINRREENASEPLPAWDVAVKLEANLALNRYSEAKDAASAYIHSFGTDAFEIGSTLRQLTEVWQLDIRQPPGSEILPVLQSAYLRRQGATLELNTSAIKEAATVTPVQETGLESIVASDKIVTLNWYQLALERCNAVGRVEKLTGQGHATGWLVNAADFFPARSGMLFVTVEHAISEDPNRHPNSLLPEDAQINFQTIDKIFSVKDVVWSSPYRELDVTFLTLDGEPTTQPLRIHAKPLQMTEPAPRVYIIGYPSGRDLEISMQDNHLLAANETLLHYRTPAEPGSGGSPVFESTNWEVVGLHHRGGTNLRRIDGGEGTYEANEGISILAIQNATRAVKFDRH